MRGILFYLSLLSNVDIAMAILFTHALGTSALSMKHCKQGGYIDHRSGPAVRKDRKYGALSNLYHGDLCLVKLYDPAD